MPYPDPTTPQDRPLAPQPPGGAGGGGGAPPSPPMGGGAPPASGGGGAPAPGSGAPGGMASKFPPQLQRFINPNDQVQAALLQQIDQLSPQDLPILHQVCATVPQMKDILKRMMPQVAFLIDFIGQGQGGGAQRPGMQGGPQQGAPQPAMAPGGGATPPPGGGGGPPRPQTGLGRI